MSKNGKLKKKRRKKDNLSAWPSIHRVFVRSTWLPGKKMVSGLRVSKQMSSSSARRVRMYASKQQGTLELADDPEEMLIQLNYF